MKKSHFVDDDEMGGFSHAWFDDWSSYHDEFQVRKRMRKVRSKRRSGYLRKQAQRDAVRF